jgi:hypothetical protein
VVFASIGENKSMREYLVRHKPYLSLVVALVLIALSLAFEESIAAALSKGIYIIASR